MAQFGMTNAVGSVGTDHSGRTIVFRPRWMLALTVVQLAMSFVAPQLGTLFGCALTVILMWLARPQFLPALIVNQLGRADFDFGFSSAGGGGGFDPGTVVLAGLPFNVTYVLALMVVVRVTWELITVPQTLRPCRWVLCLWYLAFFPAIIMAVTGKSEGNPSWTMPVRTVWLCGGFFYGHILAKHWRSQSRVLIDDLLVLLAFIVLLVDMGICRHKFRYILAPVGVPLAWEAWKARGRWRRLTAIVLVGLSMMQGLGIVIHWRGGGGDETVAEETEDFDLGGTTLTSNALFFGSVLLTCCAFGGGKRLRRAMAMTLGLPAVLLAIGFSITIAIIGPNFWSPKTPGEDPETLGERVRLKLFDDRSLIWNGSLKDALAPPYFLKPTGRPVWIEHPLYGGREWSAGAHNSVINTLQQQRWFNGPILLLVLLVAMRRNAKSLRDPLAGGIIALGIAVALNGSIGIIVNDYPMDPEGSFWVLGFAGLVTQVSRLTTKGAIAVEIVEPPKSGTAR